VNCAYLYPSPTFLGRFTPFYRRYPLGLFEERIKHLNNGNSQKIVSMRELKQYIEQGWEFVANINSKEAIIKVPGR